MAGRHHRPHPGLQDHKGRRPAPMALERIAVRPDAYAGTMGEHTYVGLLSFLSEQSALRWKLRTDNSCAPKGPILVACQEVRLGKSLIDHNAQ